MKRKNTGLEPVFFYTEYKSHEVSSANTRCGNDGLSSERMRQHY
ncbi:hypothetical protein [Citrobacter pasteurii]|nr:hypothetical protein SF123566_3825 [Shigella flexneri 1235-66]CEJ63943.1 hypothetical protein [Citrobacter pasteurii]